MRPRRIGSRRERARHLLRGLFREAAFATQSVVLLDQLGESFLGDPLDVRIDEQHVASAFVLPAFIVSARSSIASALMTRRKAGVTKKSENFPPPRKRVEA